MVKSDEASQPQSSLGLSPTVLNLIATVDAMKATSNEAYKKVYRSTFGKCSALWNKCGRSTLAAETVEDVCSLQLLHPNALTIKLDRAKLQLKYYRPLVDALLVGIKNRFGHILRNPELIAATILLLKFKTI